MIEYWLVFFCISISSTFSNDDDRSNTHEGRKQEIRSAQNLNRASIQECDGCVRLNANMSDFLMVAMDNETLAAF